jgi:hypothetical protein
LSPLRIIPDIRLLKLTNNFYEAFIPGVVVKDTPSEPDFAPEGL